MRRSCRTWPTKRIWSAHNRRRFGNWSTECGSWTERKRTYKRRRLRRHRTLRRLCLKFNNAEYMGDAEGFGQKLASISLGQGQGPIAEEMIKDGFNKGSWVLLQNCHLAPSWMPTLEKICEDINPQAVSSEFRLWLTSMPTDKFPVAILQNGIKMTNEPPKGLRANLNRSYLSFDYDMLDSCKKPEVLKKMLFGLAFFHALIQERRKFGPLGWNIPYEFNESDLRICTRQLPMFLDQYEEIPFEALRYLTGQANYGGRVTDDQDRRCLNAILAQYYTPEIFNDGFALSASGLYSVPQEGELSTYLEYLDALPTADAPEIFGMHENANITFQLQETHKIIDTVLGMQPRVASGEGEMTPEEIVGALASSILEALPDVLDKEYAEPSLFEVDENGQIQSMSTVLSQEIERFNKLLVKMRSTLIELQKALKGLVVMSSELEMMYGSFLNNQVPALWAAVAYPSLKPLASWVEDLKLRVEFMRTWLSEGLPASFWLSGFFFPQGFLTGVLQTFARKYQTPIDSLNYSFRVMPMADASEIHEPPEDGIYVYGLYVECARWNRETMELNDPYFGEMYNQMPVIHFVPKVNHLPNPADYACPLYKTSARAGVLSTTGQSTNFVALVEIPTSMKVSHWTLMGTALLTQLND
eukprot:GFYU01006044.1.p1 GENE.GFYU01006044.1~~GFYU01006044.1.p1  ORF type:complete len:643 (-),score=209.30 GFYU01006044.1:95-2023(-)